METVNNLNNLNNLNSLNKDCLHLIAKRLPFNDICNLSFSCKKAKGAVFDNQDFWRIKLYEDYSITFDDVKVSCPFRKYYYYKDKYLKAIQDGELEIVRFYYNPETDIVESFITASYFGHLDIIKFLMTTISVELNIFLFNTVCMVRAIKRSHPHLVKYFIDNGAKVSQEMINLAVEYNNKEIVEMLFKKINVNIFKYFILRKEAAIVAKNYGYLELSEQLEGRYHYWFILFLVLIVSILYSRN